MIFASVPRRFFSVSVFIFLSDRQKDLIDVIAFVFPDNPHANYLHHLEENMDKRFKSHELKRLLWKAARAPIAPEFNEVIRQMRSIDIICTDWLESTTSKQYWVDATFFGRRYDNLKSNIAEPLNSLTLEAHSKPIFNMFEYIRHQLMDWYSQR